MSRMIDLIRTSALSSSLMYAAARGALAVPPAEMLEILVYLANHNKIWGQQARLTLAGWDEASSLAVASNPDTPREVLDYLISPHNLRPCLLPALLENTSVSEESLVELAASASREVVETMLKSARVNRSERILNSLRSNPNPTGVEAAGLDKSAPSRTGETPAPPVAEPEPGAEAEDIFPEPPPGQPEGADDVLDQELIAYLSEHAAEISAEANKPFQAIGGIFDELELAPDEPAAASPTAPTAAASKTSPVVKKTYLTHEEARGSALHKISKLDVKGRIQLAIKGTKEERSILIRDGTKVVALAVLESPKLSDGEVETFASQKNVLEAVLRGIPMKRRFAKHYGVVRNLVFNPRTPLDVSLGLMKNMLVHDLRNLASNREVSETIRKLALKMFKQKIEPGKK